MIWIDCWIEPLPKRQNQRKLMSKAHRKSPENVVCLMADSSIKLPWFGLRWHRKVKLRCFYQQKCEDQLENLSKSRFDVQFVALGQKTFFSTICLPTKSDFVTWLQINKNCISSDTRAKIEVGKKLYFLSGPLPDGLFYEEALGEQDLGKILQLDGCSEVSASESVGRYRYRLIIGGGQSILSASKLKGLTLNIHCLKSSHSSNRSFNQPGLMIGVLIQSL